MKYIFRYTIITQHTNNPDGLKEQDLISALKSANFTQVDRIQQILESCRHATNSLVKNFAKSSQSGSQFSRQLLANTFSQQSDVNIEQLMQVWENEKQGVVGKILQQSCKSQSRFNKISWSVNTQISSRKETKKQKTAIVNILSKNSDQSLSKNTMQLNKNSLNEVTKVLMSAADFLDQNLK